MYITLAINASREASPPPSTVIYSRQRGKIRGRVREGDRIREQDRYQETSLLVVTLIAIIIVAALRSSRVEPATDVARPLEVAAVLPFSGPAAYPGEEAFKEKHGYETGVYGANGYVLMQLIAKELLDAPTHEDQTQYIVDTLNNLPATYDSALGTLSPNGQEIPFELFRVGVEGEEVVYY